VQGLALGGSDFVMYEDDFRDISREIQRLHKDANTKMIFVVDKNGQLIASAGQTDNFDSTSMASLTAGNIAATGGLAHLIGEREFSILFHQGEHDNIHISLVGGRVILVVIFDSRSSLGLVRLRVKRTTEMLEQIFEKIETKAQEIKNSGGAGVSPFEEITEEDIDNLFR
jgi:predicted regulator of Ras-like GTPase activity (Roadblock/LC7/MglB family)